MCRCSLPVEQNQLFHWLSLCCPLQGSYLLSASGTSLVDGSRLSTAKFMVQMFFELQQAYSMVPQPAEKQVEIKHRSFLEHCIHRKKEGGDFAGRFRTLAPTSGLNKQSSAGSKISD
jgi:hypothetical protein